MFVCFEPQTLLFFSCCFFSHRNQIRQSITEKKKKAVRKNGRTIGVAIYGNYRM
jgi:hypothetical protein